MNQTRMLSALLKHHRGARGLSQLDLAGAAGVSAKHLSFLETGRARPSREMVLRIGSTLALSLRDQNELLVAAGFSESFAESEVAQLAGPIRRALEHMLAVHEPYPVVVFDGEYDIRMLNHAGQALLALVLPPAQLAAPRNLLSLCFDELALKPYIANWDHVARQLLGRLAREHLQSGRETLGRLLSRCLAYPGVPPDLRVLDLTSVLEPVFELHFRFGELRASFLTTLTTFSSPRDVTLEELRIESYYPLDDETHDLCKRLATAC